MGIRKSIIALTFSLLATPALAQFEGALELIPSGCESSGQCILKNALRFTDGSKVVWEAMAGLVTDGASIPAIFQPLVGSPFDPSFIRAAIVHDHYCRRHVRPWRQTHRVFYDALRDQGIPVGKAKAMYFAVYLGGPKWVTLIPGNNCGTACINKVMTSTGTPGIWSRKADYSAADLQAAVTSVSTLLQGDPDALTLDQLESRARQVRPSDFFFNHQNTANADELGITE